MESTHRRSILFDDAVGFIFTLSCKPDVLDYPVDEMVLKRALDKLVEQIRCQEFVYIGTGEIARKWLRSGEIN